MLNATSWLMPKWPTPTGRVADSKRAQGIKLYLTTIDKGDILSPFPVIRGSMLQERILDAQIAIFNSCLNMFI